MGNENVRVECYSGYVAGETPRKVFMHGREFPVEYIVYKKKVFDVDTDEYYDHYRLKLVGYGECDLVCRSGIDCWELKDIPKPGKPFSEQLLDSDNR